MSEDAPMIDRPESNTCLFCSKPLDAKGHCWTDGCEMAVLCKVCDGGPANHGPCLCGLHKYESPIRESQRTL